MDFALRLKALLIDHHLSQKEFATGINVAPSTAGNYIRGEREPDYETLKAIANYFQVSTDYLLGVETPKANDRLENELLQLFRMLNRHDQELFLDFGKLLVKRS